MRPELRAFLHDAGAPDDDIARAEAEGWLPLLTLDRSLLPGAAQHDLASLARLSGVDEAVLRRLWRALGFPDLPADAPVFTERDLHAATRLFERAAQDSLQTDRLIQQVQTVSGSMARIAAVEADAIADVLQRMRDSGMPADDIALLLVDSVRWDDLADLIDYEHRVQLRAAIWRRLTLDAAPDTAIGVGFADLAGYTRTTRHLEPHEIAALVTRWEDVAFDTVAEHGARVVKTIGDEVMFVGLADAVVGAALALREVAATDPALLSVRGAVAAGPVVTYNGDFYGPVVNLASRLTDLAKADEVLAPGELRPLLEHDEGYRWIPHGVHRLRGIGAVETFALATAG